MAKKAEAAEGGKVVAIGGNSGAQLKSLIERVERVTDEIKASQDDRKEIFAEAKSAGFDVKIMRILLRRRAMDKMEREHQDALIETYETAVGA